MLHSFGHEVLFGLHFLSLNNLKW